MFRTGYITSARGDSFWFLGLPILALIAALAAQQWLASVAIASVGIWITYPHHFATWLRTFGLSEDWRQFKDRLIVGPIVIVTMALVGLKWAPLTLLAVITLWDHQHSFMQQHGFARIYDFKAKSGAPSTGKWDLTLGAVLYANLFVTSPLFTSFWLREAYRFNLPLSTDAVLLIHRISWGATAGVVTAYLFHLIRATRQGYALNPIKYLFLASSYFLWYFVAWHTASVLVYGVAHRIMHGLQYIVIVYLFLQRKAGERGNADGWVARLVRPGNILAFVLVSAFYGIIYQILIGQPLDQVGFGAISFMTLYGPVPEHGLEAMSPQTGFEVFGLLLINSVGAIHYYFDSFIWKVRDKRVQRGL